MKFFGTIRSFFGQKQVGINAGQSENAANMETAEFSAAATLPPVPLPKAPTAPQALPGYRTNVKPSTSVLRKTDRNLATTDRLLTARQISGTPAVVRQLAHSSPDLSSALSFMLRVGIPETFSLVARDMDGKVSADATKLAHSLLRRMTYLGDVDGSFQAQLSLQSLSEQLAMELVMDGAMCVELSLDKARVPSAVYPVSIPTIKFYEEDNGFRMVQSIGGEEINLDLPTIFYVSVDQMQSEAYASSYIESALQPIMADFDFNNDVRRVLKRAVLPRLVATIDSEKIKKMCPPEIVSSPEAYAEYLNAIRTSIENAVNSLAPEDAMVTYDSVAYDTQENSSDPSQVISNLQKVINAKMVAGAKTMPTVLGHGSNSNASSTEAMLYVKQANMVRVKLNELYSRMLTTAVRLMGEDCLVEFKYDTIDLRPESELEAFWSMRQSRVLELLSIGFYTDEEASILLTGNLPPDGAKPLSGTMFRSVSAKATENPTSNNSTAVEQTLTSKSPTQTKTQKSS